MRQTMNGGDWLRLGVLSVLWGGSFLFYRVLAGELPPLTTSFGRVAIGGLALLAILRVRGVKLGVRWAQMRQFVVLALLNNVIPFTLFVWGEQRVSSGTAAILNAMTPLFTVLVAGLVWRTEKLTRARLCGIAFGIAGVAVLVGPQALLGQDVLGQAACLLAAFSYGFGVPFGRRIIGVTPANMALLQLVTSSVLLLPLVLALEHPWTVAAPSLAGWASLIGIAVLSTSFAYLLFFDLLARVGAGNLSLVTFLVPGSALLLGWAVLGETVAWTALAGLALIGAGFAAIDGRLLAAIRRAPAPVPRPVPGALPPR